MGELDLAPIEACYSNSGSTPYPVSSMLRIALYCILDGASSPRQWARKVQTCLATKFLAREETPSISAFYRFRQKSIRYIDEVFNDLLKIADGEGFLNDAKVAIDGTFNSALASRHRLVNEKTLDKRTGELESAIKADHNANSTASQPSLLPKWMAKTPAGREEQMSRFQKSKEEVRKRIEKNKKRQKSARLDESKIFVSTSDPEVPISRDKKKVFGPLWPTQFITHIGSGLVLAVGVFATPSDSGTIGPMLSKVHQNLDRKIKTCYADAGFTSQSDIRTCLDLGVELIAPVQENSFTKAIREERQRASNSLQLFQKCDFKIDYDKMQCQCPNGQIVNARGHGSRQLANGESLKVFQFCFTEPKCMGCAKTPQCKSNATDTRTVRITEGESIVAEHRSRMTPQVLTHCRTIRAQTAEKSFADGKERSGLSRLGCKSIANTQAVTCLHVLAMNVKRVFSLRKEKKNTE